MKRVLVHLTGFLLVFLVFWGTFDVTGGDLGGMLETLEANHLKVPL